MEHAYGRVRYASYRATMYIEHMRIVSGYCHEHYGITVTEYELLLSLRMAGGRLSVALLADFLMLKSSTLWQMIPSLEERGLLRTGSDAADRRKLVIVLTERGLTMITECAAGLYEHVARIMQISLPQEEFRQHMSGTISQALDGLRGHSAGFAIADCAPDEMRPKSVSTSEFSSTVGLAASAKPPG